MKPLNSFTNWLLGKNTKSATDYFPDIYEQNQGWHLLGGAGFSGSTDDYEQVYASVRPIAYRFSAIRPYAINASGERVENMTAVNAIYRPNQKFGLTQFLDAIAVGVKTSPEIHLLVWRREGTEAKPGGDITRDNIAGYTFMEHTTKTIIGGKVEYRITNAAGQVATFTDKEVITLADSRNPNDLSQGYSPTRAAKRWIRLDDYIADYQGGFFKNGAVPAGMFTIVAPTKTEFDNVVANMQAKHRGAGNNNNVAYSYTPVDPTTGKPATTSSIVWTPFNVDNKDMELGVIFDNVNKKIDSSFGVPATIRGVNESVTYAGAQVDERNFVVNVLDPFTNSIWSQFTHELNRITGGLDYAITYDLDIPNIAEEDKSEAEVRAINGQLIRDMVTAGYSLDSVIDAFKLPESYKDLELGVISTEDTEDRAEVDQGGETEASPNPEEINKVVAKSEDLKVVSEQERVTYEQKLSTVVRQHMRKQIDAAIKETKAVGSASTEEITQFTDDMMTVIVDAMAVSGVIQYRDGANILIQAGIVSNELSAYKLSLTTKSDYREYLLNVAKSYSDDTAISIRNVLSMANENNWARAQLEDSLRGIMSTDEYRVTRLAVTEVNRSQNLASIDSMRQITTETGVNFEKGFIHTASDIPCEFCQTILSTWIPLDAMLLPKGGMLVGADGGIMLNDFADNDGWDVHPNGHCAPVYRVRS